MVKNDAVMKSEDTCKLPDIDTVIYLYAIKLSYFNFVQEQSNVCPNILPSPPTFS